MAKRHKIKDPYAAREAEKYDNPIPSREYILDYLRQYDHPINQEELEKALCLTSPDQQEALSRRLRAMERDGQLIKNRCKGYGLIDRMNLIKGRVIGHREGFGFVAPEDGTEDLCLSPRQMRTVLHGDRVLVHVLGIDHRGRREAAIVEVLERNTTQIVGRLFCEGGAAFVEPENRRISQDILIPPEEIGQAQHGQIVVVSLISQPTNRSQPIGKIIEVLGDQMAPGMEIDIAVRAYDIPHDWPADVIDECTKFDERSIANLASSRNDLRALPLLTIDGEDAKDFDDAVYCEARPQGGWRLFVAIADVSYYVKTNTALDKEALKRGNSVYFPSHVIPMLPEVLSNDLCSLKPNEDRLCMVCEMTINAKGKITRYRFYDAIMRSQARMTYNEVAKLVQHEDAALAKRYTKLLPVFEELYNLYQVLYTNRQERGAIDFETTETRILFGKNRKIEKIIPIQRNDAHRIIEECMLAANVSAAQFLLKHQMPILFRTHEGPTAEKLTDVKAFLAELGLKLGGGKQPRPADYAALLNTIKGRPDVNLIQTILLRSLSQAVYQPENIGHFGLAYGAYGHFTSPIRRYPDLLVHRAIRHALKYQSAEKFEYDAEKMHKLGEHCSMTERRADAATSDAVDWLKCEFMLDKVGQEFQGIITGVTAFGIFVQLTKFYVEGLVHITALGNDYYIFDPVRHRLTGQRTATKFLLGDTVQVKVIRVDLDQKQIDFGLIVTNGSKKAANSKVTSKKRKKKKSS